MKNFAVRYMYSTSKMYEYIIRMFLIAYINI